MKEKIWLSSPHMGGGEMKYVQEAYDTNWVAPLGPNVNGFEEDLKNYNQVSSATVLSSGTAAIHLALILLGVKQGDEVICSTFTFCATANPICYQHATPIFVDSERETWNMCPIALEKAIEDRMQKGNKPKAVILVHLYGMPSKMEEILSVCEKHQIPLIEDAAEALGSSYRGQKLGIFGLMGIYSFNGNKIITTSGGGAMVSKDPTLIQKATFLATQARDEAPHYQHSHIGFNYRMSNITAGIGRGQMEVLDKHIALRRKNFDHYKSALKELPIEFVEEKENMYSNRWLTTILTPSFEKREQIRLALEAENIESRPLWKPMHLQPIFEGVSFYGEGVSEELFEKGLCLPSGSNLSEEDLKRVCEVIQTCFV
ncbi:MAG: pyridoxal phosphate-dependent aminotransferase [Flavobacteriaceae bacterium]|nr:MAG: pyridoxal phosphate-dependent aminotransferase [Flavobacteriaceae bacterium]